MLNQHIKELVTPKTLREIYEKIIGGGLFRLGESGFRVRQINELQDYYICGAGRWNWEVEGPGCPTRLKTVWALMLEPPYKSYYALSAKQPVYTLLSTQDELKYIKQSGINAVSIVIDGYENNEYNRQIRNHR